jgi:hypothetical protein
MISDKDKRLKQALRQYFLNSSIAHYCQHIADNIQAYHGGVKIRERFWRAARAKPAIDFEVCITYSSSKLILLIQLGCNA